MLEGVLDSINNTDREGLQTSTDETHKYSDVVRLQRNVHTHDAPMYCGNVFTGTFLVNKLFQLT